jgi:glycosyltransferase involved in cell wall biosynthesis
VTADCQQPVHKFKVAHILPSLDIGGVEIAVKRSFAQMQSRFAYRVFTVRRRGALECGQRSVLRLLWGFIRNQWRPDVVVTSLWWAHPFGYALRLAGVRWLAFFHNSKAMHSVEHVVVYWAWRKADGLLVDSPASAAFMRQRVARPCNVVPYIFEPPLPAKEPAERDIDLVWVGRNSTQKRPDLARDFVRSLSRYIPRGRLAFVIGGSAPDFLSELGAETEWDVSVYVSLDHDAVLDILRRSRFYLLVSDFEGMSMSTIEAIQSGCVAVVRPVGEISQYLDPSSAVLIENGSAEEIDRAARAVAAMWNDTATTDRLRSQAQANLQALPLYVDALALALQRQFPSGSEAVLNDRNDC